MTGWCLVRRGHPLVDVNVTIEDLLKAEFVTHHHRRQIEHAPVAIRGHCHGNRGWRQGWGVT